MINKPPFLGLYLGYIGIMEKKLLFRISGLGFIECRLMINKPPSLKA